VSAFQESYAVKTMCRVLGVSRSGYYDWRDRGPSARAQADAELTEIIKECHRESRESYGSPRIHRDLFDLSIFVGCKRVARLMSQAAIHGVSRRKKHWTTRRGKNPGAPDRVERRFAAAGSDELWVADITYIPTWAGVLYLAVVIDVWSRKVVGWSMANHMRTSLVLDALDMAIDQRSPTGVIHHSDHGSQYTSLAFGSHCQEFGITLSMGSVGDCYDNALAESFFATLECELLDRSSFKTRGEASLAVLDFIEAFHNPKRRHSALGQVSPNNFELAAQLKLQA
jgi:putative transposase